MAKEYASHLDLEKNIESGDIPLHLTALGLDYKEGLFGKNYIEMTTFEDTKNILSDLKENKVNNIHLSYLGWNKGGYFNNGAINAKAARTLGGTKDLQSLNKFIEENNYTVDYVVNPLVSDTYGYGNETIKGVNLAAFEKTLKSSLEQEAYYIAPNVLSDNINKKESRYEKLGIKEVNIVSAKNKDMGSAGKPMTKEQRGIYQAVVDEYYQRFVEIVAEGRHMTVDQVKKLADGRIYTATQAVENGLIDGIKTSEEFDDYVKEKSGVSNFYEPNTSGNYFTSLFGSVAKTKEKSEAEVLVDLMNNLGSGVPMYYAEPIGE